MEKHKLNKISEVKKEAYQLGYEDCKEENKKKMKAFYDEVYDIAVFSAPEAVPKPLFVFLGH